MTKTPTTPARCAPCRSQMPASPAHRTPGRSLHGKRELEPASFRLPNPGLSETFRIAWSNSTRVRGAFGWFSAGWISAFAHGLAEFLIDPSAQIDITIAPVLFPAERAELRELLTGKTVTNEQALDRVVALLEEGSTDRSAVARYAVQTLAWMVDAKRLILRVAVPKEGSNYHPKVWLFEDGDDTVVIRGSANATGRALEKAIEHLDLDPSWRDRYRVATYVDMVTDWAEGKDPNLEATFVLDLDVLSQRVRELAVPPSVERYVEAVTEDAAAGPADTFASPIVIPEGLEWKTGPYRHQGAAVEAWFANTMLGLLAIATGGGKTRVALICLAELHRRIRRPLLVVIAVPTEPLLHQWREELREFAPRLEVHMPTLAGGPAQRDKLYGRVLTAHVFADEPTTVTVILTHFKNLKGDHRLRTGLATVHAVAPDILLIGDEAHGLGTDSFLDDPPDFIPYRLGLSATPDRFDDTETERLFEFFGGVKFEFGLRDAMLAGALTEYEYVIAGVAYLDSEEMMEYRSYGGAIGRAAGLGDRDRLAAMAAQRRGVLEVAEDKFSIFENLLDLLISQGKLADTLIYCSSKARTQMDRVATLLTDRGVAWAGITEDTPTDQRAQALRDFGDGKVQVLVAKRILDEGVNVPSTQRAILLASSTSPREWVQRRGRVLRRAPGKTRAIIYDIPSFPLQGERDAVTDHILTQEGQRIRTFNTESYRPSDNNDLIAEIYQQLEPKA